MSDEQKPAPWLTTAQKYLGEHEILGEKDNQFILDCFKYTAYKAAHDECAWCAAFIGRCLVESGFRSTGSAAAISYKEFGEPCELVPGAIVVFEWSDGSHHVTICDHIMNLAYVSCIGGNQSDMVKFSNFPRERIVATRWPKDVLNG